MSPKYQVPLNSVLLVAVSTLVIMLLTLFSATAWNALTSLSTISLYASYLMPILFACIQRWKTGWWRSLRKTSGNTPSAAALQVSRLQWSQLEIALTEIVAVAWCLLVIATLVLPPTLPGDTPSTLNWSGPIMGMVALLALVDWTWRGHKEYAPEPSHDD